MFETLIPDWPAPPNVHAWATTRSGGVSLPPFDSFNLGNHVGDAPPAVAENRRRLCAHLPAEPRWLTQVHGNRCIDAGSAGNAVEVEADASTTRAAHVVCAVLTADCLPVLLCDVAGTVVAAAHAGWRGLAAGILENTVAAMHVPGQNLLAWLGPHIGPAHFEVGEEVLNRFIAADAAAAAAFSPHIDGKWWCDITLLARQRLTAAGVRRIASADFCTVRDRRHFFSYRRDGISGRMASLIWMA